MPMCKNCHSHYMRPPCPSCGSNEEEKRDETSSRPAMARLASFREQAQLNSNDAKQETEVSINASNIRDNDALNRLAFNTTIQEQTHSDPDLYKEKVVETVKEAIKMLEDIIEDSKKSLQS